MQAKVDGMKIPLRVTFGQRLRELRQRRGLSQEAFADVCGFARSYMSRLERGVGNPSLDAIQTLADALGVDVVELFTVDTDARVGVTSP
jgi:transcriptional regulator with XRE-family HTH domain